MKRILLSSAAVALIAAIGCWLLLPKFEPHEDESGMRCTANLRQIGQGIFAYARDDGGVFPDNFSSLMEKENLASDIFICPSTPDEPAQGATTRARAENLAAAGHCSYLYLGKGLTSATVSAQTVIAREPPANHNGTGMHVLYGDGHVDFVRSSK